MRKFEKLDQLNHKKSLQSRFLIVFFFIIDLVKPVDIPLFSAE